ncbi:putative receptor-like protein kinase At4g00960 [Trifolium pratense]|nr:putative receptor-like protein kinase At4g00960 [Trifolium pratense]
MSKSNNFFHNLIKPFKFGSTREGNSEDDIQNIATQEQRTFSYETLVAATNNFNVHNKLGEGGFGPVYKGKLNDGREIAVKKLSLGSNQGKTQFVAEAKLLTRVQHRNVVNLYGYCIHGREKLLVYEYISHESLDKFLFRSNKKHELDWKRRFDIINGVARGLLYLHEDSHDCIIHRDIKAANILLDEKWVPKIADFGLARLFPGDETHVNTRVAGTHGYMAPEYLMHGHLSVKADVYSYGVLVLELITGHRNSSSNSSFNGDNLLNWAYKLYKKGKWVEMVDPTVVSSVTVTEQVETCIRVSLLCMQGDPQIRPTMGRVVLMLSKKPPSHMEEPTRPGVPGSRYRRTVPRSRTLFTTDDENDSSASHIDSSNFDTTTTTNSNSSATRTSSATAQVDTKGKRPMLH